MTSIGLQGFSSRLGVVVLMAVFVLVTASCANLEKGGATTASQDASVASAPADASVTLSPPDESVASAPPDESVATSLEPEGSRAPAVDRDFADMVAAYTDEHPDTFASVGWTGEDYSGFTIQVAAGQEDTPEVAWLRRQVPDAAHGGERVEFVTVTHSFSTLDHIRDLLRPRMLDGQINGLGLGSLENVVWVLASRGQIEEAGGEEVLLELLYSDLPDEFQDVLLLEESEMPIVGMEVGPETSLNSP
ncbi:hypothetical protein [Ornithinimicrobium pratense]|uniref:Uncharacterized protein n=1 Tax=Ornithinimicrobium pratense TaxID=2593973 RepID=A0A5J6V208_9MICO|nr:hypothetical protein [Ornithinimicrobium pratense]QFG67687.1 hypothetical protein FY030_02145 [Ornithinimicrobium pratense]